MSGTQYQFLENPDRLVPFLPGAGRRTIPMPRRVQTVSTPNRPFDMAARHELAASLFKIWFHYFGQFPINVTDTPAPNNFWTNLWLPPGAFDGTNHWETFGGWTRDEPLPNPITSSATVDLGNGFTTKRYTIDDKILEWKQLRDTGADGFCIDLLQSGPQAQRALAAKGNIGPYRQRLELLQALRELGDDTLKVMMMPDGNTGGTSSVADLVADMVAMNALPEVYKQPSGNLLISPYGPEFAPNAAKDPTFWPAFVQALKAAGVTPDMWFIFSQDWLAAPPKIGAPLLKDIAYGLGRWGVRNALDNLSLGNGARGAAAYAMTTFGKPWMAPFSPGDQRAKGSPTGNFDEQRGFDNLVITLQAMIEQQAAGCEAGQGTTWNDYGELANMGPSKNHGYVLLDICAYYFMQAKIPGYVPPIVRDAVYLSHRVQFVQGTTYTAGSAYTTQMALHGGTPAEDNIHVMAWAKDSRSSVQFLVGNSVVSTQAVPKGVSIVKTPLQLGNISARMVRDGDTVAAVSSPWPVSATQKSQDMNYRAISSLRG